MTTVESPVILHAHCEECPEKCVNNVYSLTAYMWGSNHMRETGHEVTVR